MGRAGLQSEAHGNPPGELSLGRRLMSHLDRNTIAHWNSHKWSLENRLTAWVTVWGRGRSLLSCLPGGFPFISDPEGGGVVVYLWERTLVLTGSTVGLKVNGSSFPQMPSVLS